jgi:hypothetical protein
MDTNRDYYGLNATFRPKRLYRNLGLGGVVGFSGWGAVGISVALTQPGVPSRVVLLAIIGGISLAMTALSAYLLAAYCRERVTIDGARITKQGVFRRVAFDLRDVTEARWRLWPEGGSVVLKAAATRVSIEFGSFEREQASSMIDHLRSAVDPGVQINWNLFDSKIADPLRRPKPTKPGPGEVLLGRDRWDCYFVPGVVVAAIIGVACWWLTAELRFLAAPVIPVSLWVLMRMTTPAEGMITRRLSFSADPDTSGWLLFCLLWGLAALGGVMTVEVLRPRLVHPDTVLVIGMVVWILALLFEAFRSDRRRSRRNREAADPAAKERGEYWHEP